MENELIQTLILAFLQIVGAAIAWGGLFFLFNHLTLQGLLYCCPWYVFCGVSHVLGLIAIGMAFQTALMTITVTLIPIILSPSFHPNQLRAGMSASPTGEVELNGNYAQFMQYNYFTTWLAAVVGYPAIVTYIWMTYYGPELFVQLNLLLVIIPLVAWLEQTINVAVRSTQTCIGLACLSHAYICFLADDGTGLACSFAMVLALVFMSTPTRRKFWQFTSREVLVILMIVSAVLMNASVRSMELFQGRVTSVLPFRTNSPPRRSGPRFI